MTCLCLGSKCADFQEKSSCCNFTTMKSKEAFSQKFPQRFFLKIDILREYLGIQKHRVYIEVCDFIPAQPRTLSIKQVLVVLY